MRRRDLRERVAVVDEVEHAVLARHGELQSDLELVAVLNEKVVGEERLDASREYLMKKIVPQFKPALLAVLEELEDSTDKVFKRAEKAIKSL